MRSVPAGRASRTRNISRDLVVEQRVAIHAVPAASHASAAPRTMPVFPLEMRARVRAQQAKRLALPRAAMMRR